jgi:hypothetical protein
MSKKDLIVVVSRGVSLYFFAWALDNITYLPGELRSLFHHLRLQSALATDYYWRNGDIWSIAFTLGRAAILFSVAIWLYRRGPSVERFFSLQPESPE